MSIQLICGQGLRYVTLDTISVCLLTLVLPGGTIVCDSPCISEVHTHKKL